MLTAFTDIAMKKALPKECSSYCNIHQDYNILFLLARVLCLIRPPSVVYYHNNFFTFTARTAFAIFAASDNWTNRSVLLKCPHNQQNFVKTGCSNFFESFVWTWQSALAVIFVDCRKDYSLTGCPQSNRSSNNCFCEASNQR